MKYADAGEDARMQQTLVIEEPRTDGTSPNSPGRFAVSYHTYVYSWIIIICEIYAEDVWEDSKKKKWKLICRRTHKNLFPIYFRLILVQNRRMIRYFMRPTNVSFNYFFDSEEWITSNQDLWLRWVQCQEGDSDTEKIQVCWILYLLVQALVRGQNGTALGQTA